MHAPHAPVFISASAAMALKTAAPSVGRSESCPSVCAGAQSISGSSGEPSSTTGQERPRSDRNMGVKAQKKDESPSTCSSICTCTRARRRAAPARLSLAATVLRLAADCGLWTSDLAEPSAERRRHALSLSQINDLAVPRSAPLPAASLTAPLLAALIAPLLVVLTLKLTAQLLPAPPLPPATLPLPAKLTPPPRRRHRRPEPREPRSRAERIRSRFQVQRRANVTPLQPPK
mmetsp:Transcript_39405/g.127532  ORF Transcript_39405/g.127532 Transcript_39405/m.127532 type:complete len:232 (+) Transcript_39405:896-1591(+)